MSGIPCCHILVRVAVCFGLAAAIAGSGAQCGTTSSRQPGVVPPSQGMVGNITSKYDRRLIDAVNKRWLDTLKQNHITGEDRNKVDIKFELHEDGSVQNLRVTKTEVDQARTDYCVEAIKQSAPFGPWPQELKELVKRPYRELNFVFYY